MAAKQIILSMGKIPSFFQFYIAVDKSIWESNARELFKQLKSSGIAIHKLEENHYKPRNICLEQDILRSSSYVTSPQTPPTDIAYVAMSSRASYNSELRNGEIRTVLYFVGSNLEVKLMDGAYATQGVRSSQFEKVNDFGITSFLDIYGASSNRDELSKNVERVVRNFYQTKK